MKAAIVIVCQLKDFFHNLSNRFMFKFFLSKKGFTLVEMLIVLGIVAIVLPAVFTILFTIIREQARVYALKQVKREGDFVLSKISNQIRSNAVGIYMDPALDNEVCDRALIVPTYINNNGDSFYFEDKKGDWFRYSLSNASIASDSSTTVPVNLTSGKVDISNFSISCNRTGPYAPPLITLSFGVGYHNAQFQEELATLNFQTQIAMKNY